MRPRVNEEDTYSTALPSGIRIRFTRWVISSSESRISMRASEAPKQKCGPRPKARCFASFEKSRKMLKVCGSLNLLGSVRCGVGQADLLAFFDHLAVNLVVSRGGPVHVHERADPADDLFHRVRNERRIFVERIVLLGIFGEPLEAARNRAARRLRATDVEQDVLEQEL